MIAGALRHAGGHRTASEIAEAVRAENPAVDVSTVYRTLDMLTRSRLATATDMGGADMVYEWSADDEPHHHLICIHCGPIAEVPHDYLNGIETAIENDFDFAPDLSHFAIFGVCGVCQARVEAEVEAG
jgi:Fur family ferric uptake transcriptional regulator